MKFITRYKSNGVKFGSYILADTLQIAEAIAVQRGLGEVIQGEADNLETLPTYKELGDEQFIDQLPSVLHTAIFLANVAMRAKTITVEEVLGDHGVVHELTHLLTLPHCRGPVSIAHTRQLFDELRERAIGFY